MDAFTAPDLQPDAGVLTAGQIRDAFMELNPNILRDGLDVEVNRRNRLTEVRVCYDRRFHYARYLSGQGAPDAQVVTR